MAHEAQRGYRHLILKCERRQWKREHRSEALTGIVQTDTATVRTRSLWRRLTDWTKSTIHKLVNR